MASDEKLWESWRTRFRAEIREELDARGMKYRDLAQRLGYADASSISYHMTGRGPTIEFVEAVAGIWPRFREAPIEFRAARYGTRTGEDAAALRRREMRDILDAFRESVTDFIDAMQDIIDGGDDAPRPAPRRDHEGRQGKE